MSDSGNCYKVKLAIEQLRIPYRWVEVNSAKGETRTPEFLARNPNGKVPTLALEDGSHLAESNAILHYLADGTPLLPTERLALARAGPAAAGPRAVGLAYWIYIHACASRPGAPLAAPRARSVSSQATTHGHSVSARRRHRHHRPGRRAEDGRAPRAKRGGRQPP